MKLRFLKGFAVLALLFTMFFSGSVSVFAADESAPVQSGQKSPQTILPVVTDDSGNVERFTVAECENWLQREVFNDKGEIAMETRTIRVKVLTCAIMTGQIKLWMVPYYITYALEFLIGISGLLCVLAIVIGGFYYLFSGISEDKETGKKAVLYGLVGMILTLTAWGLVNIFIGVISG